MNRRRLRHSIGTDAGDVRWLRTQQRQHALSMLGRDINEEATELLRHTIAALMPSSLMLAERTVGETPHADMLMAWARGEIA